MSNEHETRRNPEMEKWVTIRPVVNEDWPNAHNVFLQVENQRFCVSPHGCETRDEAEWMRDMLCIALARIAADENELLRAALKEIEQKGIDNAVSSETLGFIARTALLPPHQDGGAA